MRLLWITHRKFDDFCATTPVALSSGLVQNGFDLTIVNPDQTGSHDEFPWSHISIQRSSIKGFQGLSFSKRIKNFLPSITTHNEAALVDWQVGSGVIKLLSKAGLRVYLIDRSPPADEGIFARLQWKVWKKSWRLVDTALVERGFVVSPKHAEFVSQHIEIKSKHIEILPAGIYSNGIKSKSSKKKGDPWRFVYHGRLDRHRGILDFMNILSKLNDLGLHCIFTVIGDGTAVEEIKQRCDSFPNLFVYKTSMSHGDIHEELGKHHIGVLPMPENNKVWTLASPLKRGEYLAGGLMVVGLDHDGHRLQGVDAKWFHLDSESSLTNSIYDLFKDLSEGEFNQLSIEAQNYATNNLSWDVSVHRLVSQLRGEING